jgi:SAM-dependent methyltransferase
MACRIGKEIGDGRCSAPAAERNRGPILTVLERVLPVRGLILEIGSGTGQHVAHFAGALPQLLWQPSDADAGMRQSISAWIAHERLVNVREPIALDIRKLPWPVEAADAIVCVNVLHVAPWATTQALFEGARDVLPRGGILFLYGPYRRGGRHTAPSNERFDAELRAYDPEWGVREVESVSETATAAGFRLAEVVGMPANNLSLVFRALSTPLG